MTTYDLLMLIAVVFGPILAVIITLWYSKLTTKRQQKMDLFLSLVATRKTLPMPPRFIDALNMIDVVFHGDKGVINAWRALYKCFGVIPYSPDESDKRLLDLLDEMATSLGYDKIKQTTFDDFYFPQLLQNQASFQAELGQELLRVLKNSQSFGPSTPPNQNSET